MAFIGMRNEKGDECPLFGDSRGVGKWFARERLLANTLFLTFAVVNIFLIIIGTFFRGPNWTFVSPW